MRAFKIENAVRIFCFYGPVVLLDLGKAFPCKFGIQHCVQSRYIIGNERFRMIFEVFFEIFAYVQIFMYGVVIHDQPVGTEHGIHLFADFQFISPCKLENHMVNRDVVRSGFHNRNRASVLYRVEAGIIHQFAYRPAVVGYMGDQRHPHRGERGRSLRACAPESADSVQMAVEIFADAVVCDVNLAAFTGDHIGR